MHFYGVVFVCEGICMTAEKPNLNMYWVLLVWYGWR